MFIGDLDIVQVQGGDLVLGEEFRNPEYQHPIYLPLEKVYRYPSREWCVAYSDLTGEHYEYDPTEDPDNPRYQSPRIRR